MLETREVRKDIQRVQKGRACVGTGLRKGSGGLRWKGSVGQEVGLSGPRLPQGPFPSEQRGS